MRLSCALAAAASIAPFAPTAAARERRSLGPVGGAASHAVVCVKTSPWGLHPVVSGLPASIVGAILCLTASAALGEEPLKLANTQLEPVKWTDLAGWTADDHRAAFAAFQTSCQALRKIGRTDDRGQLHAALWSVCRKASGLQLQQSDTARIFFEENFQPVRIARLGEVEGILTGYFEPVVQGSRFPNPEFHVPVYRRPPDLVAAGYKPGSTAFPNKGARIGRFNEKNQLVPYYERGAIEAGALDGRKLEICWLKDPFDLLTIQIEGSGRVILEDGTPLRISYDSHNGYPYSSISRALIQSHRIPREEISMQRIRQWMAANPDEAPKIRATNRSYVFFRVTGLSNDGEPVGAQGVPLTPGRSIAVDRLHEYGTPFFIEANLPVDGAKPVSPFHRLMIAQDTGSAIVGPARADLYWGAGDDAARIANHIRHPGRFVMLLPRELDMIAAGRHMPLPVPRPGVAELVMAKKRNDGKIDTASYDDRWREAGRRTLPSRDCPTGSGLDCSRISVPRVGVAGNRLPVTSRGPSGGNQQQQHQQQGGRREQLAQQPQPWVGQGPQRKPQLPATEGRGPRQKRPLQPTEGGPQQTPRSRLESL